MICTRSFLDRLWLGLTLVLIHEDRDLDCGRKGLSQVAPKLASRQRWGWEPAGGIQTWLGTVLFGGRRSEFVVWMA